MNRNILREALKSAFIDGFYSYDTPCNPNTSLEKAWEEYDVETVLNKLLKRP